MNTPEKLIAGAIVGGSYLVAATILFVGIGVAFVSNPAPKQGGELFLGGLFLTMIFLYVVGIRTLSKVSKQLSE